MMRIALDVLEKLPGDRTHEDSIHRGFSKDLAKWLDELGQPQ